MINLGPAGSGLGNVEGMREISKLGLKAAEIEFVYGVRMKIDVAKKLGDAAKKEGILLSIHAPYYINIASLEKEKTIASVTRIIDSCERGHYFSFNGRKTPIVFHAAFYLKREAEIVYNIVRAAILEMQIIIDSKGWNVLLCPETTGKKTQFGSLDELLRLSKETKCGICVDFAHLLARDGVIDYDEVCKKLVGIKNLHAHFSGIEYSEKGERRHLVTSVSEMKKLINALKKYKIDITIVNESPDPVGDSLKMAKLV